MRLRAPVELGRVSWRAEAAAEGPSHPHAFAELLREADQHVFPRLFRHDQSRCAAGRDDGAQLLPVQHPSGSPQVLEHGIADAEVLEEGDDVGERLVERGGVLAGRFQEMRARVVEKRMGRLVGDDVV